MNVPLLALIAFLITCCPALAQSLPANAIQANVTQTIDPAKAAEIRKMFELTGMIKTLNDSGDQILNQLIGYLKPRNGSVSPQFWEHVRQEFNTSDVQDKIMLTYDKYYSLDDLKAMNAFYASPAGQHMFALTPLILRESQQIGQEWGNNVGQKIQAELELEKQKAPGAPTSTSSSPARPATMLSPAPSTTTAPGQ